MARVEPEEEREMKSAKSTSWLLILGVIVSAIMVPASVRTQTDTEKRIKAFVLFDVEGIRAEGTRQR